MYFLKRLLFLIPVLIVISMIGFALAHVMPGGPFDRERAPASPEIERNIKARFHLDEPVWKQYLRYIGLRWERDEQGQWRHAPPSYDISFKYRNHSVTDIISQALPVSVALGLMSFCFAQAIGIPLGFFTAVRRGQWGDYAGSFFAILVVCVPALVVGPLLAMWFGFRLGWLPAALWESPQHVILPTMTLGLYFSGKIARLMREGMLGVMNEAFIITARSKGLSDTAVLLKHGLRIGILPVVSYSGPLLADLLTGSFVVEKFFAIPGIGPFFVNSINNRDHMMTVGLLLLYAVMLLTMNFLVDVAYGLLDRRVKYE